MDLVGKVIVFAHQESQVFQEALDPRDQQVVQDRPALKDPQAHEETKATMASQEVKAPPAPRDLKGPPAQWDHKEPKVTQVLKGPKVLRGPRDLLGHCEVTGNSACLKI